MTTFRIALANLRFPTSPEESVTAAERAIELAGAEQARIVCFPESFVPGHRLVRKGLPPADHGFLERAWATVAAAAARSKVAVVLGTERVVEGRLLVSTLVVDADGIVAGFQDKVQLDPAEDRIYSPGSGRRVFQAGPLTFGVSICHEGFRYPETVRWAARQGAQVVFHPHIAVAERGGYVPATYGDPQNTFHEKAVLCRAAENTCYVATVNCASAGSPTTSAVAAPDGTLMAWQPYDQEGLLVVDLDLSLATGRLAKRLREGAA
jgi:predicted amidohydrolase